MRLLKLFSASIFVFSSIATSQDWCATLHEGSNFTGSHLRLNEGDQHGNLGEISLGSQKSENWDNRISSLKVKAGCSLSTYQYQNFGVDYDLELPIGWKITYTANSEGAADLGNLSTDVDNKISSVECSCSHGNKPNQD